MNSAHHSLIEYLRKNTGKVTMQIFPFGNGFCISLYNMGGMFAGGEGESYEAACYDTLQFLRVMELL